MKSINDLFRDVILLNELSGDESAALRFSDPDGPSGRSGWSFGICQFDTKHNDQALLCLQDCGFTPEEIDDIRHQRINVRPLAARLRPSVVARYDAAQLSHCLFKALNATTSNGIVAVDTGAILCLADYVNQYGSIGKGFVGYLQKIGRPIVAQDIQDWKLNHTKYGREHRADCKRRFGNVMKVLEKEGLA